LKSKSKKGENKSKRKKRETPLGPWKPPSGPSSARVESLATTGLWGPLVSVITHLAHQPGRACRLRRRLWWSPFLAVESLRTDRPNPSPPNSAKSAAPGIKYHADNFPLLSISLPTTELFHGAQVRRPGSSVVPLLPGSTVPRLPLSYSDVALTSPVFGAWPTGPLGVAPAESHGHITLKLLRLQRTRPPVLLDAGAIFVGFYGRSYLR
jgi:hypothetical protein